MQISVDLNLVPTIDGRVITTAPTVSELHGWFGQPSRVEEGKTPAPVGHRNNQIHLYDDVGVYFYEHHHTRRISGCKLLFREAKGEPFATRDVHSGAVMVAGAPLSKTTDLAAFLKSCPLAFERTPIGWFRAANGAYSAILSAGNLSLSWPHDPWALPEGGK